MRLFNLLTGFIHEQMTNMDTLGPLASSMSSVVNWATETGAKPRLIRKVMEGVLGIHHRADLPKYVPTKETFTSTVAYLYRY